MDGSAQDEEKELALACAAIEPVPELLQVAREVLGVDAMKRPAHQVFRLENTLWIHGRISAVRLEWPWMSGR